MLVEYKQFPNKRRFGVEIELNPILSNENIGKALLFYENNIGQGREVVVEKHGNCWKPSKNNNFWHVKHDSSCGPTGRKKDGGGWEVASFVGQGKEDLNSIGKTAEFLHVIGAKTNSHCGLHAHVEADDFTISRMGILLANWARIEPILFQACPLRRRRNRHCKPFRKKIKSSDKNLARDFYHATAPVTLRSWENNDKRYTINIVGYTRFIVLEDKSRPTIELRLPESSLNPKDVTGWLSLMVCFVESCSLRTTMPKTLDPATLEECFEILGFSGEGDRFFLLDQRLYETEIWFLDRIIKHSSKPVLTAEAAKMIDFVAKI